MSAFTEVVLPTSSPFPAFDFFIILDLSGIVSVSIQIDFSEYNSGLTKFFDFKILFGVVMGNGHSFQA